MVLSENFKRVFVAESTWPFQKTVAVVAGSFKPPTAAHWDMVEKYAGMADKVVVIVSNPQKASSVRKTATGAAISAEQAKEVFEIYAKRYGLNGKVEVVVSPLPSPVSAAYGYIDSLSNVNAILGVSKKGGDEARFAKTKARYADKKDIFMVDPLETAVEPYVSKDGIPMSATDARAAMVDPEAFEKYLPEKLTQDDAQKVEAILGVGATAEAEEESSMAPLEETEEFHLEIDDSMLSQARASAWNAGVVAKDEDGKDVPVNPKKFPERAIRVAFVCEPAAVEIFLDGKTGQWDSDVDLNGQQLKLSPDQMGSFFRTQFFQQLRAKLRSDWPTSDETYSKLFQAVAHPEMAIPRAPVSELVEDGGDDEEKVTASGRKITHFSDQSINSASVKAQCWPRWKHEFLLGQWKNWKYLGSLCKLSFKHSNGHEYNIAVSPLAEDWDLRGFRGYDVTQQPPVQWLTKEELAEIQQLSIFQKFCSKCAKRILHYAKMDPEEVAKKVGKPKRLTPEDVAKLQKIMRTTAQEVVSKRQMDSFRWK